MWILGFFGAFGDVEILLAELIALKLGLAAVWNAGIRFLYCYSDSLGAIELVLHPIQLHHHYAFVVADIKDLLLRDWEVRLSHTLWEAN